MSRPRNTRVFVRRAVHRVERVGNSGARWRSRLESDLRVSVCHTGSHRPRCVGGQVRLDDTDPLGRVSYLYGDSIARVENDVGRRIERHARLVERTRRGIRNTASGDVCEVEWLIAANLSQAVSVVSRPGVGIVACAGYCKPRAPMGPIATNDAFPSGRVELEF